MEIKMINGKKFELIKDNEGFILEEVENKLTDYYDNLITLLEIGLMVSYD